MGSGATDLWPYVASGPNRTFRPGFDAALRLPETGHSHIVHYSRLVKVSCAGLSCRSLRRSVCAAIARAFGMKGGKRSFAATANSLFGN